MTTITTTITTRHIGKQDFRDTCTYIRVMYLCDFNIIYNFLWRYQYLHISFSRSYTEKKSLTQMQWNFFPVSELNIEGTMNSCIYIISEIGLYRIFNVNYIYSIYNKWCFITCLKTFILERKKLLLRTTLDVQFLININNYHR